MGSNIDAYARSYSDMVHDEIALQQRVSLLRGTVEEETLRGKYHLMVAPTTVSSMTSKTNQHTPITFTEASWAWRRFSAGKYYDNKAFTSEQQVRTALVDLGPTLAKQQAYAAMRQIDYMIISALAGSIEIGTTEDSFTTTAADFTAHTGPSTGGNGLSLDGKDAPWKGLNKVLQAFAEDEVDVMTQPRTLVCTWRFVEALLSDGANQPWWGYESEKAAQVIRTGMLGNINGWNIIASNDARLGEGATGTNTNDHDYAYAYVKNAVVLAVAQEPMVEIRTPKDTNTVDSYVSLITLDMGAGRKIDRGVKRIDWDFT